MDNKTKDEKIARIANTDDRATKNAKKGAGSACPDAPMIGSDGNIFNQVAIASKALKDNGGKQQAKEMSDRVFRAESYDEAISIICEYVNPVDRSEYNADRNRGKRGIDR